VVVVAEKAIGDVDVVNASTTAANVATMIAVVVKVFIVLFWDVVAVPCRRCRWTLQVLVQYLYCVSAVID
jgi:hypothetical protein